MSSATRNDVNNDVIIIGAGIGGLALALSLHRAGVPFRIFETASDIKPLGVGLNLLPHAVKELTDLGLQKRLLQMGIETGEYCFYTRHGQLVYREPRGKAAGYDWPQISIHRGDLHLAMIDAVRERVGPDAITLSYKCVDVAQEGKQAILRFVDPATGKSYPDIRGAIAVCCDGVHSVARAKMHPKEAVPRYEGTTQYRGTTRWKPFLTGASMSYMGTYETGKLIIYPIRNNIDDAGRQLINWVIEVSRPDDKLVRDWNRKSRVEEFISNFAHCTFDWLDVPAVLSSADAVYEYPMVDQEPLPFWTLGRITLLGDAAHPMMPRGSNGAAQAIIDAKTLAGLLASGADWPAALSEYESIRMKVTADVVLANRQIAPDAILRVVEERTKGQPFKSIDDVISHEELVGWQERYRNVAGFSTNKMRVTASKS